MLMFLFAVSPLVIAAIWLIHANVKTLRDSREYQRKREERRAAELKKSQRVQRPPTPRVGGPKVILTYGANAVIPDDLPPGVIATRQMTDATPEQWAAAVAAYEAQTPGLTYVDDDDDEGEARIDRTRYSEREIVYVLERLTSEGRFFKIGMTNRNDVSLRAREVRSTVISYTNDVRERDVHRELRHYRLDRRNLPAEIADSHGPTEWFRPTPEVEAFAFDGVLPSGRTARMVIDRQAA